MTLDMLPWIDGGAQILRKHFNASQREEEELTMVLSGIFNNKKPKVPKETKDTWTGKVYKARNQAYQALALSEGMDPTKPLGWFDLCRKYPLRFEDVVTGRKIDSSGRAV